MGRLKNAWPEFAKIPKKGNIRLSRCHIPRKNTDKVFPALLLVPFMKGKDHDKAIKCHFNF